MNEIKQLKERVAMLEEALEDKCCNNNCFCKGDRVVKLRGGHKGCLGTILKMKSCRTAIVRYDWEKSKEFLFGGWTVNVKSLLKIKHYE